MAKRKWESHPPGSSETELVSAEGKASTTSRKCYDIGLSILVSRLLGLCMFMLRLSFGECT